jgi:puromycin-sensitive aminopeptidase
VNPPTGAADPDEHRLPRAVRPTRYELGLVPDLDAATFFGTEAVAIEVSSPLREIVCNAAELTIEEAWVVAAGGERIEVTATVDESTERATFSLATTLEPGTHTLHARFTGILNDKLRGFYRSTFVDAEGVTRTLATTQFESTDARRAFPCWDEPEAKATFAVTLVVPEDLLAISNGAEVSSQPLGDGRRRVTFAETMPMSTYLVAFVVGPLEATTAVDVDGVPLRVVHPLGKAHLTDFALEVGAAALRFYTGYYGIAYPGGKVDLVAIPDFAFGAMENLGCITFRETALLADTALATQPELERVADVIAHELAHMWFGDLVTMRWWNGIWLNEAFATFMETLAVDAYRPEWQRWVTFALSRSAAFDTDSLAATRPIEFPVLSPADAEGMFDVLTYEKGASVVRMCEQYLGADEFRAGIRAYLAEHSYGNTETTDLWDALEVTTGQPVRNMMDTWIFQGGYPLLAAGLTDGGATLELRQSRFRFVDGDDGTRWLVPVLLRIARSGEVEERRLLLEEDATTVDLGDSTDWVLVNAGGSGFYRVRYDPGLLTALTSAAQESLSPLERYGLVDDTWASVLAGATTAADFLTLVRGFAEEDDLSVWRRIAGALATLERIVDDETRPRFAAWVRALVAPALHRLGDEPQPGEPERTGSLRATLFETLGTIGDDEQAKARAADLDRKRASDPTSVDAELADAAVRILAPGADSERFDRTLDRSAAAVTPQDTLRFLGALADVDDPVLFDRFCDLLFSDRVRTQDVALLLNRGLANRKNGGRAWAWTSAHWDDLLGRLPHNAIARMVTGVRTFTDPKLAEEVDRFLVDHTVPQAAKAFAQHRERLRVTVSLAERETGPLADFLQ